MKEWIEYNFGWQDWNKIKRRLIQIVFIPVFFYLSIQVYWFGMSKYFSSSTNGEIISLEPLLQISQSRYGNNGSRLGYKIKYAFRADGKRYESPKVIKWKKPERNKFEIWYNPDNPNQNILVLK